tara:strand:+ start:469 stop:630 length:162 start_codon:yes stop_codon:yes gene_type:complete
MYYTVELRHHVINGNYSYSEIGFDELDDAVKFAKKEDLDIPGSVVAIRTNYDE